jgi:prepilin-type processing-associated H-X9-DG protein
MALVRLRVSLRHLIVAVFVVAVGLGMSERIGRSRGADMRHQCENNLKQIGLGLNNYLASNNDTFPAGTVSNAKLHPERRLSWCVLVISYLEQAGWLFDMSAGWESPQNRTTRAERGDPPKTSIVRNVSLFTCPAGPTTSDTTTMPGLTSYVAIAGVGRNAPHLPKYDRQAGVFGHDRAVHLADIRDGTSMTMVVAETTSANGPWTAGGRSTMRGLDPARQPYIGEGRQFGGSHAGGALVLFADGSVRFIRDTASPYAFEALATMAGGEDVDVDGVTADAP